MDIQSCARRAQRIILVGLRRAKERHDGVANVLIDRSAIADDNSVNAPVYALLFGRSIPAIGRSRVGGLDQHREGDERAGFADALNIHMVVAPGRAVQ
jgi:hypothetical protein